MDATSDSVGRWHSLFPASAYWKYACVLAVAWSLAVAASLAWNYIHNKQEVRSITFRTAQALLEKDLLYRQWSILHGGVYIPKTDQSVGHPPDGQRDILAPSGQVLTLLNPAEVSRQIFQLQERQMGIRGRITSLHPIRPENLPDDWERRALMDLAGGTEEVSGIEPYQGEAHFRMMRPLFLVPSCLRCHEERGRTPGELRGGISVTVPMKTFLAEGENQHISAAHFGLWGIGMTGLFFGWRKFEHHDSERRHAEEVLKYQFELTETITRNASTAIFLQDREGRCTMMNPAAEAITGYSFAEVRGKSLHDTIHSPRADGTVVPACDCPIVRAGEERRSLHNHEDVIVRKDRAAIPVLCSASPILKDGVLTGVVLEAQDITDRKKADEKIQADLREKEVLLQEIHHRVKNNLQVISSLLQLQINQIQDPQTLAVFQESQIRVRSMALIHEKLYESDSLARIDLADYLRSLTHLLFSTYASGHNRITLAMDLSPVCVSIDAAVPLGLIANELVTNSLKFAFGDKRKGVIRVELKLLPDESIRFCVSDDGIGLPAGFELGQSKSLGVRLVRMLTTQLEGDGNWERLEPGTRFTLSFRDKPARHRDAKPVVSERILRSEHGSC